MTRVALNKTGAFIMKHKVVIAVILVVIVVAIIFYRKGKSKTTLSELPTDAPEGSGTGNGGVNMSGQQISTNEVTLLAADLHEDIHEIFGTRNTSLYERLANLSDTDLIRVYNTYNTKYQAEDNETMLEALESEFSLALFSTSYTGNVNSIISRLRKYNTK
jgi:hypothetical protein